METRLDLALGLGVIVATVLGPILAVGVTRHIDRKRAIRERQLQIFRSLMATRRAPLSAHKVDALNMVEIDFFGFDRVQHAYRDVMAHTNTGAQMGWDDRHRKLMTILLTEIATVLGYKLQQLEVLEGGYYPQGFVEMEGEQQAVRRALIQVLSGNRPLVVSFAGPTPPAPFPPPPATTESGT